MSIIKTYMLYKVVISSLTLSLGLVSFYSYNYYTDFQKQSSIMIIEKKNLIKELNKYKSSLDTALSENVSLKSELNNEKKKVDNLLNEINESNLNVSLLIKYKNEINRLGAVVISLTKEKLILKKDINLLQCQQDSTLKVLTISKNRTDTLLNLNENLHMLVKKAAKITLINLKTTTHKKSNSGISKETNKAKKVNLLQTTFTVVGNKITKPCQKEYFIQIIDAHNNIIGKKHTQKFDSFILDYSYISKVNFKGESINIVEDFDIENAEKGTYFVNIFDKSDLVLETAFTLY